MILAEKIIKLRKQNGWLQEELAARLNVSRQSVSKNEERVINSIVSNEYDNSISWIMKFFLLKKMVLHFRDGKCIHQDLMR